MTGLAALWLPILLSAVLVFVVSSLIHTVTPWHKSDYPKLPNEDKVMDLLRPLAIPPGDYMMPRPSSTAEMRSPQFAEKFKRGPVMMWTDGEAAHPMVSLRGRRRRLRRLHRGAGATSGRLPPRHRALRRRDGLCRLRSGLWQMSIWYRRAWLTTIKATVDGLIYALLTAGTFVWLWPL